MIAAQDQTDIGDGLRATLPLAGRTLIEHQAGLATAAGAAHIVVLVERVPAVLAQAIDRLRRQGARIEIARSVADAIDRFHPAERIMLVADGAVAAQGAIDALADEAGVALLALPDTQDYAAFERIDAAERWAGYALMDKATLEATARMLGDWDLSSTLLRRLVQADAVRIDALDPSGERPLPPPVLAIGPAAIGPIEAGLMRRADPGEGNWVELHLHRLVAAPLIGPLIARQIDQRLVAYAAVGIAWLAALLAGCKLFWGAALLLPIGAATASAAQRMTRIWGGVAEPAALTALARHAAALAVLVLLTRLLAAEGGWGWWLVAALLPAALAGAAALDVVVAAIRPVPAPRWLASGDALVWVAPLLAVLGGWRWMLAALTVYAVLSFLERFLTAWKSARICDI
ncbi:hypothetical protein [Sphingomonas sp. Root720]|uniref:hypothetical protein n=1 Tax=Sphingomonas sp. Root720 TaxID=1736595 RepID=UPI0006FF5D89|nr:hypothetical protein [Sphingomonas sp. Root720]KQX25566.1 hypothetical protein ASD17_22625 [Sphingomonas sp. Root1294]KQY66556.1 hypothetical protein ASD39_12425 [Sphingomonas sp. Root50]KRB90122.1 hypothetical protein ASE22_14525 [Sphingomonas sp. Root720]